MDNHCLKILNEYRETRDTYVRIGGIVDDILNDMLVREGIEFAKLSSRVKTEESLAGKLELKGGKYGSLLDITDIFGARVSTLYNDEVDMVAAIVERLFTIDWENSVDKRRLLESDRFGYMSVHYICTIPEQLYYDEQHPEINTIRFEIQIRTVLQDIWATINHDIGYKSDVEIPREYKRTISRLAGLLDLADDEFRTLRRDIAAYRDQVHALVRDGKFDDISLNKDSYQSYLTMNPFSRLNDSIASALKADIASANLMAYYDIFTALQMQTLGDIERLKTDYSEDAKRLALHRLAGMEIDIISSTVAVQNLCIVAIIRNGYGAKGIENLLNKLNGARPENTRKAERIFNQAQNANIL